ncbi:TonB-dependent receptor [Hymenobacter sp. BT770]|uniref:TonB-dependent receptor domain-containing protein n=1 Tax=Hymenobacter sp. BT770 TaxID=2886942 RepID=UPI001D11DCD6|nr:TonB-dependent receptor [Hymenobacter sp. BT770]MCC3152165.1 TonB-dependent receptor [Hymenobacter sp. BT770]MDO3413979.1 TonB-dependent receptor [Hymenobacter sp. BT770]
MKLFSTPSTLIHVSRSLRMWAFASLLLPLGAAAQTAGPGSVSGSLKEDGTGNPVPFSDVLLLRAADSTFVAVAQTNDQGAFKAASLPLGTYLMRVQDLNYKPLRRRFTLTAAAPAAQLQGLKLTAATATKLSEVVVTGQKATVVEELGKRVINVEKDLGSVGGTAANVLQNVPSVSVDVNGTVSMRGTSNVTILIDGKPAGVSNGNSGGGQRLDQIPASRIAQVEVITNPSAKYDASGGGGVINLITKKETKAGTNGTAALNVGTGDKYSGNLNLSRKVGKATWSAGYNGRDVTYQSHGHSEQTALLGTDSAPQTVRTTQVGIGSEVHRNHNVRVGVELELPKSQTLSLNVSPGKEVNLEGEGQELTQQTNNGAVQRARGRQDLDVQVKVLNYDGSYRRTWAEHKGRELTANFGGVVIDANVPVVQRQFAEAGSTQVAQPGTRQQLSLLGNIQFGQVDYTHPLAAGKGRLEMGVKLERQAQKGANAFGYASSESRPNDFQDDPTRSLTYTSEQLVPAAYVTVQRPLGPKWSAQAGLRSEYTILSGTVQGGAGIAQRGSLNQDYLNFFPSATINREFGKEPGQNRLQFSYARRLNRPNFMQQLPLAIYQDPRSYRLGNPRLRAEFSHNIELGHQLNLGQATITSTVFARITTNSIQRLRFVDTLATRLAGPSAGLVTAETYLNVGRTTNLGAELSVNQPLAKWWRLNASTSIYRAQIASNSQGTNRQALVGTLRLTNNFTIRPTLDVQLSGNLRSASLTVQGRQLAQGQMDIALRQRLFSDRAALTLRVSDLLNTQQYRSEIATDALSSYRYAKDESRVGWLGFTWYIGASKAKPGRIEAAPQGGGGFGG